MEGKVIPMRRSRKSFQPSPATVAAWWERLAKKKEDMRKYHPGIILFILFPYAAGLVSHLSFGFDLHAATLVIAVGYFIIWRFIVGVQKVLTSPTSAFEVGGLCLSIGYVFLEPVMLKTNELMAAPVKGVLLITVTCLCVWFGWSQMVALKTCAGTEEHE